MPTTTSAATTSATTACHANHKLLNNYHFSFMIINVIIVMMIAIIIMSSSITIIYIYIYIYIYTQHIHTHICIYIYIYIYRERERERYKAATNFGGYPPNQPSSAEAQQSRPTSLLTLFLLRLLDSNLPGDSYGHDNSTPFNLRLCLSQTL